MRTEASKWHVTERRQTVTEASNKFETEVIQATGSRHLNAWGVTSYSTGNSVWCGVVPKWERPD